MVTPEKRALFAAPDLAHRPMYYFTLPAVGEQPSLAADQIRAEIARCRAAGCSTLIPQLPTGTELVDIDDINTVREMFRVLLTGAEEKGLLVGFYLDPAFERVVIRMMDDVGETRLHARLLERKEYICREREHLERRLHEGELVSLVAYSEAYGEAIDLRPHVKEGKLVFDVPAGNWIIQEYLVIEEQDCKRANYLSYEASYHYVKMAFSLFFDVLSPHIGKTLRVLSYSGLGFHGLNRRDWDSSFNRLFTDRFGFDPAPYYPALFSYLGNDTLHIKTMLMTVRASMLQHGIMQAVQDFATEMGLTTFGNLSEPKQTACSWHLGDAMLNNVYSPCALFDKAYLYGTNSVKIAAGAAYNFDVERVNGELFRNYAAYDKARLLKDAMNAFARGVNNTAVHLPPELSENSEFGDFTARVQLLLRNSGRHVADIAMLYPIYDLHSHVNLYFYPANGYEYPAPIEHADYMTLINAISFYAGHDLTVLHPEALASRCHTEGGILYLDNKQNREEFRVIVLPATEIISLENMRMLKKFFDEGGKILATGRLPSMAFERDENGECDREVCALSRAIFGEDACNPRVMRRYCQNRNEAGGDAIFLYFNASAFDGTRMTKSSTVSSALNSFGIPFDIYMPGMQRFEGTGALNAIFPEFHEVGLDRSFPGGGMLNHVHKRGDSGDVYYFSNTTDVAYDHHVLLRGAHTVEEWNPHTGEITPRGSRLLCYMNELYTDLRLTLPARSSTFFCTTRVEADAATAPTIKSIDSLQSEHALRMSEF